MIEDNYIEKKVEMLLEKAEAAPSGSEIASVGLDLILMLLEKNVSYGDSALNYESFIGSLTPQQAIFARINDKLKRIKENQSYETEGMIDAFRDTAGYFILLLVLDQRNKAQK
jgi:hypothetical protein